MPAYTATKSFLRFARLKWHRLTDPDPVIPARKHDLNLSPSHATLRRVEYLPPPIDRYVIHGGWKYTANLCACPIIRSTGKCIPTWHRPHRRLFAPTTHLAASLLNSSTAGKLSQWNPFSHQWTLRLNNTPEPSYYETADIDFHRHLLVACGRQAESDAPRESRGVSCEM